MRMSSIRATEVTRILPAFCKYCTRSEGGSLTTPGPALSSKKSSQSIAKNPIDQALTPSRRDADKKSWSTQFLIRCSGLSHHPISKTDLHSSFLRESEWRPLWCLPWRPSLVLPLLPRPPFRRPPATLWRRASITRRSSH